MQTLDTRCQAGSPAPLTRSELDEGLSYRCTTCRFIHTLTLPPADQCRAGLGTQNDDCTGTTYEQGRHWFRNRVGDTAWDRGCWHFVPVAKGQNKEEALEAFIARLRY